MKTTVEIADSLLAAAKSTADARGLTLRELIEEGLRSVLERERLQATRFRLRDGSFGGQGLQADIDWSEIRRKVYEGRGE